MLNPTTSRISRASKETGRSVVIACALILTSARTPCLAAKGAEHRTAAAAPQVGGQAISLVITPGHKIGEFITSASLTTLRNRAKGLLAAWRLAFARILAKVDSLVPYSCICARPAPPK